MVTKREWLVSQGLAKAGRGKFSNDAKAALAKAISEGMEFDEPVVPVPSSKPRVAKKAVAPKEPPVKQEKSTADPAAVREWAKKNGVTVSDRGRVSEDIKMQYEKAMESQGGEVITSAPGNSKVKDVRPHGPLLVPESQTYVTVGDHKEVKGVTYKSACANSGVSIGYCGETVHRVVTSTMTDGLVEVEAL
jgi:histone H3/H4